MTMFLRILIGRLFGKTAYEVITSPITKMQKALDSLARAREQEVIALEVMISRAADEQAQALATAGKLRSVL